jgi:hypothetical protein
MPGHIYRQRRVGAWAARSVLITLCAVALTAVLPAAASAATGAVVAGTPASGITSRASLDTFFNDSVIDTGHPVTSAGAITQFNYYAKATGTIAFFVVDASNKVLYITPNITVSSTGPGSFSTGSPVPVAPGDRIGYWSQGTGVIPFDSGTGGSYVQTNNNAGEPTLGSTVVTPGSLNRTYSFNATNAPTSTVVSCVPNPVSALLATRCTATVTDTGPGATTPTGTVTFTQSPTGAANGTFSSPTCTLSFLSSSSASCSVDYTPLTGGSHTVTASYGSDVGHAPSAGSVVVNPAGSPTTGCTGGPHCGRVSSAAAKVRSVREHHKHHHARKSRRHHKR